MNPLSNALNENGYYYQIKSPTAETHITYHLLLKVYAATPRQLNQLTKVVEPFTTDIKMEFGLDKCRTLALDVEKWN